MRHKFLILTAADVLLAYVALFTGFMVRFGYIGSEADFTDKSLLRLLIPVCILVVSSYVFEVYNLARHRGRKEIFFNILLAAAVSFIALSILYFIAPQLLVGRGLIAIFLSTFVIYQFLWHIMFVKIFEHPLLAEKIIVFGTNASARGIGDFVHSKENKFGHILVGYIEDADETEPAAVPREMIIGNVKDLTDIALRERVSQIVVSVHERRGNSQMLHVLLNCKLHGIEIIDAPSFFEPLMGKLMLEDIDMNWLIYSDGFRTTTLNATLKKTADVLLSLIGIILSIPFLPIIALLVKLDSPGPVFFTQERIGLWGRKFNVYKFRTMRQDAERETGAVWAQENDIRIKPVGRFLRKCRLDEIPQLFNVLKGDMSFVGPRPERPEFVKELERQIPFYAKRHFIKPGITGLAQVKFYYGSSVADAYEKLRYDLYYFKNMSLIQDLTIILRTFKVVLIGNGR